MSLSWPEIKHTIRVELLSRRLADPKIRLRALDTLDELLAKAFPSFRNDLTVLADTERIELERILANYKSNGKLNGAEKSVLKNVFDVLAGTLGRSAEVRIRTDPVLSPGGAPREPMAHKLVPLANVVARLLEEHFGEPARFKFEQPLIWLDVLPKPDAAGDYWEDICRVYATLVDDQLSLPEQMSTHSSVLRTVPQKVDIWFAEPYSFALEYDEDQHFNQFRLRTFLSCHLYPDLPLDLTGYTEQCMKQVARPGNTGFTRLKGNDPLFPRMLNGEMQDNRTRQRAFRDFLKDVIPLSRASCNKTWRIGSYLLAGKRSGFDAADCRTVERHIRQFDFLQHVTIE